MSSAAGSGVALAWNLLGWICGRGSERHPNGATATVLGWNKLCDDCRPVWVQEDTERRIVDTTGAVNGEGLDITAARLRLDGEP